MQSVCEGRVSGGIRTFQGTLAAATLGLAEPGAGVGQSLEPAKTWRAA